MTMSCVDVPCERGMDWTPLVPDCNWEADIEYRHVTTEVLIVEATEQSLLSRNTRLYARITHVSLQGVVIARDSE